MRVFRCIALALCSCMAVICLSACNESISDPVTIPDGTVTEPTNLPAPEFVYESTSFYFSEPPGISVLVPNGLLTEYNGGSYYFSKKIPEEKREAIILETGAALRWIQNRFNIETEQFTIYLREGADVPRVNGNALYMGADHFETYQFAIGIAQMAFGNEMPYGLVYALGMDMAEELGYTAEEETANLAEALTLVDSAPAYLDLNYACFLDCYADEETLPRVKGLAIGFYEFLKENDRTDWLSNYSNETYLQNLNNFLAENGKPAYDNSDLNGTVFYPGGVGIRLVWENSDSVFYVAEDYKVTYLGSWDVDMLNSGYENLRFMVTSYIAQASFVREKLGHFNPSPVTTVFMEDKNASWAGSIYSYQEKQIHMYAAEGFGHEYGHHLLFDMNDEAVSDYEKDSWLQELVCHYYTYYPTNEAIATAWYRDMVNSLSLKPGDPNYDFDQAIYTHLGHEMDWYSMDDYMFNITAYTVMLGQQGKVTSYASGIAPKLSFMHYLVTLAGEQDALQAVIYNEPEPVFGKDWVSLIADWNLMLEDFSWALAYSKTE